MSFTLLLLMTTALMFWTGWLWSRRKFYSLYTKLPGPLGLPLIGICGKMMNTERFLKTLEEISVVYKSPCTTWLGTDCIVYISDPETVEKIFQSSVCTNKGHPYDFLTTVIGEGLFTSKSPRWNAHRRMLNPAFGRKIIETFIPIFNKESNVLIRKLSEIDNKTKDLYVILKKCVLEAACQTTLGQKMDFQDDGSKEIINAYTCVLETVIGRILSPWVHPDALYSVTSSCKLQQKAKNILNDFIGNNLKRALLPQEAEKLVPSNLHLNTNVDECDDIRKSKSKIFIECARAHFENGNLSFGNVVEEAHAVIAASFDTISTTVYFVCLSLALYPEHQDKLFNELNEVYPKNDDEFFIGDITPEQLEQLTYTEMVINETMRLYAPVPVVLRSASADFELSDGILAPKGTQFVIDIFNMQRSENVWGPKAKSFDPELHFAPTNDHHPFAFVPFTKGLRMCIGYRYAMLHMKIIVAKIFRNFRVLTNVKPSDVEVKGNLSLKLVNYPYIKFQKRV